MSAGVAQQAQSDEAVELVRAETRRHPPNILVSAASKLLCNGLSKEMLR